ncbi:MAG TPA: STAS domain-containing protein [Planctomycetota bacterium]|jgi:anti-anti-sigma factor|nr:STAS domain-containing protein [Planctomycetota bacterium]
MKLVKEARDGITVLTLKGEFDSFVTGSFSAEIGKLQEEGANRIVLNQRLVKYINSTALGSIIKARKACREAGGDLVVSSPSPAVREAMESLGLDRVFRIFEDDDTAVAALASPAEPGARP